MQEITLKLTVGQVNLILEALGGQPYLRVYELIEQLQHQAQAQLAEAEPTPGSATSSARAAAPLPTANPSA
jgi:hypothetical protein